MRIQRFPLGLLNVFSAKDLGATPAEVEDKLRFTVESLQFYGAQARQILSGGVGASAPSATVPQVQLTIPANTFGLLFSADAAITTAVATTAAGFGVALARPDGPFTLVAAKDIVPAGGGQLFHCPFQAPYPILLPPGSIIGALLYTSVAGNSTVGLSADVALLS